MNSSLTPLRVASRPFLLFLATACPGMLAEPSHSTEIVLPADTVLFAPSPLKGFAVAQANCVVCHSTEYIRSQPPLSLATWKSEVAKMKKVFGAPIPDDQLELIAEYIAETYGTGTVRAAPTSPPASK
jgi:sulfite dehydrogenase (cytochrome) subunit B